jgi:zinc transporter, ZIP family
MIEALVWGAAAAAMLLIGAVIAYVSRPSPRLNAVIMAAGAGLLLGSVAYDLIEDALRSSSLLLVTGAFFLGSAAFVIGDQLLDRLGAAKRKDPAGGQADGTPLAIVMGSVLDGIPESFVLGLTVLQGGVSMSLFVGVALSNLPEGMASSSGLRVAGWSLTRVARMWLLVVAVSALAAAAGYVFFNPATGTLGPQHAAFAQAFAAGALLTMLADTMLPEAYKEERDFTGALVVLGFAGSLALAAL